MSEGRRYVNRASLLCITLRQRIHAFESAFMILFKSTKPSFLVQYSPTGTNRKSLDHSQQVKTRSLHGVVDLKIASQ